MNHKQLALDLAVKTFAHVSTDVHRDHGDWVIDVAKKYEAYLGEGGGRFSVLLESHGAFVLNTIKVIKIVTGLSFMDAKNMCLHLPQTIKSNLTEEEAIMVKNQFIQTGAQLSIERENESIR